MFVNNTQNPGGGGGYTSISLTGMLVREQISTTQKYNDSNIQTQKNRMPQSSNPKK